ncbi:MAG: YfcE family phosphodiesterase [Planctomycetes bacterium]|nr:YfcE family phosphodiesterase [Planctomycetota bacterium]MBI3833629.1 YfcE family phosphodiesterase [Planctomycetota bacterium]
MSDSHGRVRAVRRALEIFDGLGVGHIVHCGDVGDEDVFAEFVNRPFTFVWGNTDSPSQGTFAFLRSIGIGPPESVPVILELDGKKFAIFHGHERGFEVAIDSIPVDYILHGHTHVRRDERINKCRIINPGALHRARPKTIATLDIDSDLLAFQIIED